MNFWLQEAAQASNQKPWKTPPRETKRRVHYEERRKAILDCLAQGPATRKEIAAKTKYNEGTLYRDLAGIEIEGLIESERNGKWATWRITKTKDAQSS